MTPTNTWPELLLSGLAGSLLSAAATIIVVVVAIRHERRLRHEDRLYEAAARARGDIFAFDATYSSHGRNSAASRTNFAQALQSITDAMSRAQRSEPEFALLLNEAGLDLHQAMDGLDESKGDGGSRFDDSRLRMSVALGQWATHPDHIRHGLLTYDSIRRMLANPPPDGLTRQPNLPRVTRGMRVRRWIRQSRR